MTGADALARVGESLARRLFGSLPRTVGRYRIAGRIGAGGMGEVYRAHDPALERPVAVKVLARGQGSSSVGAPAERARMLREARALASISHPNVVEVFEVGTTDDGVLFITMELVDGLTLREWKLETKPDWRATIRAYAQAGRGLEAAHLAGVIHRDFKPTNALMGTDDRVRVLDFGLAKPRRDVRRAESSSRPWVQSVDVTQAGAMIGTPAYMAPECLRGEEGSERGDQFSFCVSLWEALFGGRPYAADSPEGVRRAAEAGAFVRPEKTPVPAAVIDALVRGIDPDPSKRWPAMAPLLDALEVPVKPKGPIRAIAFAVGWLGWKVAAGALLVMLFPGGGEVDPCASLQTQREDDWSSARQADVRGAFENGGRGDAWPGFSALVDEQMTSLSGTYAEVCAANASDGGTELTTELGCLRRRYVVLSELVAAAPGADAKQLVAIEASVRRNAGLPGCDEGVSTPLPAEMVAAIAQADAVIAEVAVMRTVNRYDEAAQRLQELARTAAELGHEPLQARVAKARADIAMTRGRNDEAEDALVSAYQLGVGMSDHRMAMDAAARMVQLLGVELSRSAEALQWARHSEAAATRLGRPDPKLHLYRVLGNVYFSAGDHERAAAMFERAAATMKTDERATPIERIDALRQLGNVHLHQGQPAKSRDAFAEALVLAESFYGPSEHDVAALAYNLALATAEATGDPAQSLALFERSVRLYGQLWDDHPDLGDALYRLGKTMAALGRVAEAEPKMREGIAMLAKGIGAGHPYVLDCRAALIDVLLEENRGEDALREALSVHADAQAALGDAHPVTTRVHAQVGSAQEQMGNIDDARIALEAAARLSRERDEPDPRMVWSTTATLAEFRARHESPEAGRAQLDATIAEVEEAVGREDPLWADYQLRAVELLDTDDATAEHLTEALAALDVLGRGALQPGYARAQFSVARLEHAHGEPASARARAEALSARLRQNEKTRSFAAEVDQWIASADATAVARTP